MHLDYVQSHADGFRAIFRPGLGTDPEVLEIVESVRATHARRILKGIGVTGTPRPALRGWIGAVEAVSLDEQDQSRP